LYSNQKKGDKTPFKRNGDDLILVDFEIPLIGALTGHKSKITHLDGREVILETTGIVSPGEIMKIPSLGMPVKNQVDKFGNLIVKFSISFPAEITDEQKQKLLEIFPKPNVEAGEGVEVYQCEKEIHEDMHDTDGSDSEHGTADGPSCAMQ